MLAITRRKGQKIVCSNGMVIMVVKGKAQIGIVAPADVKILRSELVGKPPRTGGRGDNRPKAA